MSLNQYLIELSLKDPDLRRMALERVLRQENLPFDRQEEEPSAKTPRGAVNYLISPEISGPSLLFCAHYDAVSGSYGANDNAAALCILIALAKALRTEGFPARFVFFDGEESGNTGSCFYVSQMDRQAITGVINLDVCGYGDTIAVYDRGNAKKASVRSFCDQEILAAHNGILVKYLPKSDEASFSGLRIPAISIASIPRWDIQYLKALSSLGSGFLGHPPEFDMILSQMDVSTTMHGGYRDSPEWVEPEAMIRIYDYLMDALHAPENKKKRFLLF
ncbi:M28 family peptidase [Lacrimispora indolis]|uniref:M28 family peptidase n=1 Tax=Lacrimispora indolis TaxID=69825 RepID=UPI00040B24D4|nr:M28 family peptidase [[Clostridium] methoxybenzovorans]